MNPIPLFAVIACLLAGVCVGQEKKDAKIQDKPVKQWVTDVLDATQGRQEHGQARRAAAVATPPGARRDTHADRDDRQGRQVT